MARPIPRESAATGAVSIRTGPGGGSSARNIVTDDTIANQPIKNLAQMAIIG